MDLELALPLSEMDLDPTLPLRQRDLNLALPFPLRKRDLDLALPFPLRQRDLDLALPFPLRKRDLDLALPLPITKRDLNPALLLKGLAPTLKLREKSLTPTSLLRDQDHKSMDQALSLRKSNLKSLDPTLYPTYQQWFQLQLLKQQRKLPSETRKTHVLVNHQTCLLLKVLVPVLDPALPLRVKKLRTHLKLALQTLLPHSPTSMSVDLPQSNRRGSVSDCVWNQKTYYVNLGTCTPESTSHCANEMFLWTS